MYAESRQNENKGERGMGKYVLKRFGSMLITLFLIATVTFFLMHLIPGDPFSLPRDTPEFVRIWKKSMDWISLYLSSTPST